MKQLETALIAAILAILFLGLLTVLNMAKIGDLRQEVNQIRSEING